MLERLHRSDRLPERARGLLQRQVRDDPQLDHVALVVGQVLEELRDPLPLQLHRRGTAS
jgi:hypothetical protein